MAAPARNAQENPPPAVNVPRKIGVLGALGLILGGGLALVGIALTATGRSPPLLPRQQGHMKEACTLHQQWLDHRLGPADLTLWGMIGLPPFAEPSHDTIAGGYSDAMTECQRIGTDACIRTPFQFLPTRLFPSAEQYVAAGDLKCKERTMLLAQVVVYLGDREKRNAYVHALRDATWDGDDLQLSLRRVCGGARRASGY